MSPNIYSKEIEVLIYIVKQIVSHPNDVSATETQDDRGILVWLKVNPEDMGAVIGREGVIMNAIRTIIKVIGVKANKRIAIKVEDPRAEDNH